MILVSKKIKLHYLNFIQISIVPTISKIDATILEIVKELLFKQGQTQKQESTIH